MKFKYPPVVVIWDDATSEAGWVDDPHQYLKPTHAVTVGFLIAENEEYLVVADTYIEEKSSKTFSCSTKIPKGWVKEIHLVNITRKRKNGKKAEVLVEKIN